MILCGKCFYQCEERYWSRSGDVFCSPEHRAYAEPCWLCHEPMGDEDGIERWERSRKYPDCIEEARRHVRCEQEQIGELLAEILLEKVA